MDAAATHGVRVIFIQQEFDQNNARRMAEATGCRLVSINLQGYDWSGEMIRIADALADGE
jgi:zinc transport system substrate-binding protein